MKICRPKVDGRFMRWLSKLQMSFSLLSQSCQLLHLEGFIPNGCSEFTSRYYLFLFVWAENCQNRKSNHNGDTESASGCTCTSGNFEYNVPRDEKLHKNLEGRNWFCLRSQNVLMEGWWFETKPTCKIMPNIIAIGVGWKIKFSGRFFPVS